MLTIVEQSRNIASLPPSDSLWENSLWVESITFPKPSNLGVHALSVARQNKVINDVDLAGRFSGAR